MFRRARWVPDHRESRLFCVTLVRETALTLIRFFLRGNIRRHAFGVLRLLKFSSEMRNLSGVSVPFIAWFGFTEEPFCVARRRKMAESHFGTLHGDGDVKISRVKGQQTSD